MLVHIVMWKLKSEANGRDKAANAVIMKDRLEALPAHIPEIHTLEVGIDISRTAASYDVVLYSQFKDAAALESYRVHPDHIAVGEFIGQVVSERRVVDYYTEEDVCKNA